MIEDLLGNATWPLAIIVVAFILGITAYNINEQNHKNDVRVACIDAGGTLGESHGWPTCSGITAK